MSNPFKHEVGMYGGAFDPLHLGHVNVICQAASECKELWIVLSCSKSRDSIPWKKRMQWLHEVTRCFSNVHIIKIEDTFKTKEEYASSEEAWKAGADEVKRQVGKTIDAVYVGSDYDPETCVWRKLYLDAEIIAISREAVPVSSTEIREDPLKHWDMLPDCVKPSYVKKILIVGNESVGKSTLVTMLAKMHNGVAVLEHGREVCERCGGEGLMTNEDFTEILLQHKLDIMKACNTGKKLVVIDTDALTTCHYAKLAEEASGEKILAADEQFSEMLIEQLDAVIFMSGAVPYVADGLRVDSRNEKTKREEISGKILELYKECKKCINKIYEINEITYAKRLIAANEIVKKVLKNENH